MCFVVYLVIVESVIADPTLAVKIDLAAPTVTWDGWFFAGIVKPNFNTSRLFDQLDSYLLMDAE